MAVAVGAADGGGAAVSGAAGAAGAFDEMGTAIGAVESDSAVTSFFPPDRNRTATSTGTSTAAAAIRPKITVRLRFCGGIDGDPWYVIDCAVDPAPPSIPIPDLEDGDPDPGGPLSPGCDEAPPGSGNGCVTGSPARSG
jgi:hypothetical protein